MIEKVALRQVGYSILGFSPVSIIPQMLHIHFYFSISIFRKRSKVWKPANQRAIFLFYKKHGAV
jgi:hypothetical protein